MKEEIKAYRATFEAFGKGEISLYLDVGIMTVGAFFRAKKALTSAE